MASSAYPRSRWEREGSLPFDEWGLSSTGLVLPGKNGSMSMAWSAFSRPHASSLCFPVNGTTTTSTGSTSCAWARRRRFGRRRANVSSLAPASFYARKASSSSSTAQLGQVDAHAWRDGSLARPRRRSSLSSSRPSPPYDWLIGAPGGAGALTQELSGRDEIPTDAQASASVLPATRCARSGQATASNLLGRPGRFFASAAVMILPGFLAAG